MELDLYTWGTNKNNCCLLTSSKSDGGGGSGGSGEEEESSSSSTAAGAGAGAAATDGNNKDNKDNIVWEPQLVDDLYLDGLGLGGLDDHDDNIKIKSVHCSSSGSTNTAVVTTDGDVYVVGENKHGELGLGHTNPVTTLTKVVETFDATANNNNGNELYEPLPPIDHVEFGPYTSAFVAVDGRLFTCGFGGSLTSGGIGSLGHGDSLSLTRPKLVSSLVEDGCCVQQVQLGESHSTVLTTEGEVLSCGSNSYGRLGNGYSTSDDQLYFDQVEILNSLPPGGGSSQKVVNQIAGGKSFTLALDSSSGVVYGWGRNHKGQLGTGFGMAVDMYRYVCV